jgi:hypothetical protein
MTGSINFIPHHLDVQIEEKGMGRAFNTHGIAEK